MKNKSMTDCVKIDKESMSTEIQVMATKLRMSVNKLEENDGEDLTENELEQELSMQRVYDVTEGSVHFRRMRVTNMKTWIVPTAFQFKTPFI